MSCRFCNDIGTAEFMFPGFVYILIGSVRKQAQFILVALRGIKLQNLPFVFSIVFILAITMLQCRPCQTCLSFVFVFFQLDKTRFS